MNERLHSAAAAPGAYALLTPRPFSIWAAARRATQNLARRGGRVGQVSELARWEGTTPRLPLSIALPHFLSMRPAISIRPANDPAVRAAVEPLTGSLPAKAASAFAGEGPLARNHGPAKKPLRAWQNMPPRRMSKARGSRSR